MQFSILRRNKMKTNKLFPKTHFKANVTESNIAKLFYPRTSLHTKVHGWEQRPTIIFASRKVMKQLIIAIILQKGPLVVISLSLSLSLSLCSNIFRLSKSQVVSFISSYLAISHYPVTMKYWNSPSHHYLPSQLCKSLTCYPDILRSLDLSSQYLSLYG